MHNAADRNRVVIVEREMLAYTPEKLWRAAHAPRIGARGWLMKTRLQAGGLALSSIAESFLFSSGAG